MTNPEGPRIKLQQSQADDILKYCTGGALVQKRNREGHTSIMLSSNLSNSKHSLRQLGPYMQPSWSVCFCLWYFSLVCHDMSSKFVSPLFSIETVKFCFMPTRAHCEPAHSNQPSGTNMHATVKVTEITIFSLF